MSTIKSAKKPTNEFIIRARKRKLIRKIILMCIILFIGVILYIIYKILKKFLYKEEDIFLELEEDNINPKLKEKVLR